MPLDLRAALATKPVSASMAVLKGGLNVLVWRCLERAEACVRRGVHGFLLASDAKAKLGYIALCGRIRRAWETAATQVC